MQEKLSSKPSNEVFLLEYLANRFTYYPSERWMDCIRKGRISVNGLVVYDDLFLSSRDLVEFFIPEEDVQEPPVDKNWKLIYEDDVLFVVDKPGDLPVHPAGRYKEHTLLRLLERSYPDQKFFTIHRIDRETSGLVLFAKDEASARFLAKEFQRKNVRKKYLVWVYGLFKRKIFTKGYLVTDPDSCIRKKVKFISEHQSETGLMDLKKEYCETIFSFLGSCIDGHGKSLSLVLAEPITGKTHQIRATLQSLGFPLIGDKIYGVRDSAFLDFLKGGISDSLREELGGRRQALHAFSLEFNHPLTKERMDLVSSFPNIPE